MRNTYEPELAFFRRAGQSELAMYLSLTGSSLPLWNAGMAGLADKYERFGKIDSEMQYVRVGEEVLMSDRRIRLFPSTEKKAIAIAVIIAAVVIATLALPVATKLSMSTEPSGRGENPSVTNLPEEPEPSQEERKRQARERKFRRGQEVNRNCIREIASNEHKIGNVLATYDFHVMTEEEGRLIYGNDLDELYGRHPGDETDKEQRRIMFSAYLATANYYLTHLGQDGTDYLAKADKELRDLNPEYEPSSRDKAALAVGGFGRRRVAICGKTSLGEYGAKTYALSYWSIFHDGYLDESAVSTFMDAIEGDKIHVSQAMLEIFELTQGTAWSPEITLLANYVDGDDETNERLQGIVDDDIRPLIDLVAQETPIAPASESPEA